MTSWRDLIGSPSVAEVALLVELHKDPETRHVSFHKPLYLGVDENGRMRVTEPDYLFESEGLAVYLDGPPHNTLHRQLIDERINMELIERGWTPLRIKYNGRKPTETKLRKFRMQIKEALK